jgi:16S rRNA (cytidine1402-2'-O)-methyltransferase
MASGMNGQQFRFAGYLPVDTQSRVKALRDLEADSQKHHSTQTFIETPYRNNQMVEAILQTCKHSTLLCIAANITGPAEYIRTRTVAEWKKARDAKNDFPDLHKQPTIFCLLATA